MLKLDIQSSFINFGTLFYVDSITIVIEGLYKFNFL